MNDTKEILVLNRLAEVAKARERPHRRVSLASIRVSPGGYLAAASVLTFTSALLLRSENNIWALVALAAAWLIVPVLACADRIAFDGQLLIRRGPLPLILLLISGRRQQLCIADFEKVDTNALRTLRRGGRVRYRYRTQITGKGIGFSFASGGKSYREMVRQLFPLIHDDKLDLRTRELRDYLCDPKSLRREVQALRLASADVLDGATADFKLGRMKHPRAAHAEVESSSAIDIERALQLRRLGNKLRIAGRLMEAGEAFRRALNVIPRDSWLIYDFARLLRSQASARGDARLLSRTRAALRLSTLRAQNDANLLSMIGESFLECGEAERAQRSFQRAIDLEGGDFRSRMGLADVALRNGKLAHVIHQYRGAAQAVSERALALFARREADYYARLSEDDDYLCAELQRINWIQNSTRVRPVTARVTNASILIALIGPYVDPALAEIGWSLASSSLVAWVSTLFAAKLLSQRRKPRPAE